MAEIINIFNFLKEFNELSNPVITEIDNQKWSLDILDIPKIEEIRSVFLGHGLGEMDYLEIKRPTLLPCPNPQNFLVEWIKNDWKSLSVEEVEIADKLPRTSLDGNGDLIYRDEFFTDDKTRIEEFDLWISERNSWMEIEVPKARGLELYNRLFQLYSEMKLESESVELMLGDGIIRWYTSERVIDHPVLLQKVLLNFDAHVPSFRIYCEEKKSEIYTPMLRVIPSINQKMLSDIIMEIDNGDYDIAQPENTKGLFKRLINVIDNRGEFVDQPRAINDTATIHSTPVLFLRKRTLGFSSFINGVIEDLQDNPETKLPSFFKIMSGIYTESPQEEIIEKNWNYNGIDEDVLLTLPANNEQLRIIKYLDKYGAVLVQGPPGTGKTHTIANLIGHLLSQGNSVLVTSHTEKALTVLKEKVYRDPHDPEVDLQKLCISIMSSTSQKKEMDDAINEIASKSSSIDLHSSLLRIERLKSERKKLVDHSKRLTADLTRARSVEYKDLIFDNHSIKPIDAAKFLFNGIDLYDYMTGKSNNDEIGFPLTHEELVFLYSSNEQLSIEEEQLLMESYLTSEQIISTFDFDAIVDRIHEIQAMISENIYLKEVELLLPIDIVRKQLDETHRLIRMIKGLEPIGQSIINKTIVDFTYPKLWDDVHQKLDTIQTKYEEYRKLVLNYEFSIDEAVFNNTTIQILQSIIDSEKEKPVGLLAKGEWKRIRDAIKLNGKVIELRAEFIIAYKFISYEIEKQDVIKIIRKLLSDIIDIDQSAFDDFENKIRRYKNQIESALNWYQKECKAHLTRIEESAQWSSYKQFKPIASINNLDEVISNLKTAQNLYQVKIDEGELFVLMAQLNEYKKLLTSFSDVNPHMKAIMIAVHELDKTAYANHLKALFELFNKNEIAQKRIQLISRIKEIAPTLAKQIENREGKYSQGVIPDYFDEAWKHFQLRNQFERIDGLNPEKIQTKIEQVNTQLLKNARILALEKAWYEKIKNQTDKQNQALQGWRKTIQFIGKGFSKNDALYRAKARELMPLCQTAIPVWIMPLNRVVETFDPRNNKFDVIIIDEASQSNILSIAALYLAKKVIIVGDDEQVSPDTFGVKTEEVNALVAQHLERIPNNHLYNGLTSLYDMAKSSGFKPLMLTEHFRCLPEIIGFCNELSYNGRIKPLRDSSNTPVHPPVVEYRVSGASRNSKKVNEVEVEHIVSLIQAFLEMPEYKGQTIGVISMLGNEQSAAIQRKLQAVIEPLVYEERRIQCGTPPQFQGDERDIIILSLVDSPNEEGGPLRLLSEDGNNDKYRKRYNVAVSRARNQLWVVHSLNSEIDLKPDDLRLKLIKYAMNPNRDQDDLLIMSESPFEKEVMKYLLAVGYKVFPQFKVGAYRIDMVIKCGDKQVALECDGERFHTADNLDNDLARQAILERLGWRFIRIRGSAYYRNPEQTMKNLVELLSKYEVYPLSDKSEADKTINDELINEVKIKARAYRNEIDDLANISGNQEEIEPKDIEESINQIDSGLNVNKDSTKHNEMKTVGKKAMVSKIKPDRQEREVKKPLSISNQTNTKDRTIQKAKGREKEPIFDFRGKQTKENPTKENTKDIEDKATEIGFLGTPKFDFRNRKS